MNKLICKIAVISFLIFSFSNAFSQTKTDSLNTSKVIIEMVNGDEFIGEILKKGKDVIILKTENGNINLITLNVKSIEKYDYTGRFRFPNPHDTRYFFGPSAIPIKKGKGYYQNIFVTTNFVNYGITKNISIGGGLEFISTVLGRPLWFFTPKVGFEISENFHAGGGIMMIGSFSTGVENNLISEITTLAYGAFTLGSSESNLSVGLGYGFIGGKLSNYPAVMLSGTHRLSNSIALLSENYIFPNALGESTYMGIQGIRILAKKNSFDIGIVFSSVYVLIPALPYVGYARAF